MMRYAPESIVNISGLAYTGKTSLIRNVFRADYTGKSILQKVLSSEVTIFSLSSEIKKFATENNLPIAGREDYGIVHDYMHELEPDYMTNRIMKLRGKVVLDGLRMFSKAKDLQNVVSNYHTCTLVCPDEVRFGRYLNAADKKGRIDIFQDLPSFVNDENRDLATLGFSDVMEMHDISPTKIDVNRPSQIIAVDVGLALRKFGW